MKRWLQNGTLVTASGLIQSDLLIADGKIAAIETTPIDTTDPIIDLTGKYILPGMIDLHVHLDDVIGGIPLADSYASGSEVAVRNGITTLWSFITQSPEQPISSAIQSAIDKAVRHSYCSIGWHLTPTRFDEETMSVCEHLIDSGFRSFKFYTTYREAGLYIDYETIGNIMERFRNQPITFLFHCEDEASLQTISTLQEWDWSKPITHAYTRPEVVELAAVEAIIELAEKYDATVHIVHVSCARTVDRILTAKETCRITCETAPHYLFLDDRMLQDSDQGYRWLCSPPLRPKRNVSNMAARAGMGQIDLFATDHCAFSKVGKSAFPDDVRKTPKGIAGIGALPHLAYVLFGAEESSLPKMARHLSENPARVLQLYPQKGTIAIGSDADLTVIDLHGERKQVVSSLMSVYETYPGFMSTLNFPYVFVQGTPVIENFQFTKNEPEGAILCNI